MLTDGIGTEKDNRQVVDHPAEAAAELAQAIGRRLFRKGLAALCGCHTLYVCLFVRTAKAAYSEMNHYQQPLWLP